MDFTRTYLPASYVKLNLQAPASGEYALRPDCLHIFARGKDGAMVGFANDDKSAIGMLTVLEHQWEKLDSVARSGDVDAHVHWFQSLYPDVVPMVDLKELDHVLRHAPRGTLQTVTVCRWLRLLWLNTERSVSQCSQYHYSNRCIILGDAANTVAPYLGLGLNTGLESLGTLFDLVPNPSALSASALDEFTRRRYPSLVAAHRISLANFQAVMAGAISPLSIARRELDFALGRMLGPKGWRALQELAHFRPDLSLEQVELVEARQTSILRWIGGVFAGVLLFWFSRLIRV